MTIQPAFDKMRVSIASSVPGGFNNLGYPEWIKGGDLPINCSGDEAADD
jgi:hypothetical protein